MRSTSGSKLFPHNSSCSIKELLLEPVQFSYPVTDMASKVPLLDEQDFNFPPAFEGLEPGGIDAANNFMWYFFQSQFYEAQSNNTAILNFHRDDPGTHWVINDRKAFDEKLRSIGSGLQFVVAGEPQGEGQPWLYQRQNVIKRADNAVDKFVEGNWYNQGTRILMAPSLLDVVRARLVSCCLLPTSGVTKRACVA